MFHDQLLSIAQQNTLDQCFANKKDEFDIDMATFCWIAYKNLAFSFVNDEVTENYFHLINPNLQMPKRTSLHAKTMAKFARMQHNVQLLQDNGSRY